MIEQLRAFGVRAGSLLLGMALPILASVERAAASPLLWPANGHYYEVVVDEAATWQDAFLSAEASTHSGYKGHLVTVTSADEDAFVSQLIRIEVAKIHDHLVPPRVFLGGAQPPGSAEPAGGWLWVTDEPFTYTNWLPGEPDNGGGDGNVVVTWAPNAQGLLQWNDVNYLDSVGGYEVEYEPEEEQCSRWVERRISTGCAWPAFWKPGISGDRVVWHDNIYGNSTIFFKDLTTGQSSFPISFNRASQVRPAISGKWTILQSTMGTLETMLGGAGAIPIGGRP